MTRHAIDNGVEKFRVRRDRQFRETISGKFLGDLQRARARDLHLIKRLDRGQARGMSGVGPAIVAHGMYPNRSPKAASDRQARAASPPMSWVTARSKAAPSSPASTIPCPKAIPVAPKVVKPRMVWE